MSNWRIINVNVIKKWVINIKTRGHQEIHHRRGENEPQNVLQDMKKFFTQNKERGNCCENQQKSYKLLPHTKHNGEFMDFSAKHIVDARDIFLLEIKTFFSSSPIEIE